MTSGTQNQFTVRGKCSEKGIAVSVSVLAALNQAPLCSLTGDYVTVFDLKTLPAGPITITASQTDTAQNLTKVSVTGVKDEVVCNPFGGDKPLSSDHGLVANLAYLPKNVQGISANLSSFWNGDAVHSVTDLLVAKYNVPVEIFNSQLNTPNQSWTKGFTPQGAGTTIKMPGTNDPLEEYFSLQFRSRLKLQNKTPGRYYIGALSDDGVVVKIAPDGSHFRPLVISDTHHPEKFSCPAAQDFINFTAQTDLPVHVTYFQGPRTQIALQLVWKRIPTGASIGQDADSLCSMTGFFDPAFTPSKPTSNWAALQARGWEVIPANNFFLPVDVLNRCQ